jgi:hypothetical protein
VSKETACIRTIWEIADYIVPGHGELRRISEAGLGAADRVTGGS